MNQKSRTHSIRRHPRIKALNQWIVLWPGRPRSPPRISRLGNMVRRAGTVSEFLLREFWHQTAVSTPTFTLKVALSQERAQHELTLFIPPCSRAAGNSKLCCT